MNDYFFLLFCNTILFNRTKQENQSFFRNPLDTGHLPITLLSKPRLKCFMKGTISDIKGIGEKARQKILSVFTEEEFMGHIDDLNFEPLIKIAIDSRTINDIIRYAFEIKYDFSYNYNICKSEAASKIQTEIIESLKNVFTLEINKKKCAMFYPTSDSKEVQRRQELISKGKNLISKLTLESVEKIENLLEQETDNTTLKQNIIYVFDEKQVYNLLKGHGLQCLYLSNIKELEDLKSYAQIRFVYSNESKLVYQAESYNNLIAIKLDDDLYNIVPELFFIDLKNNLNYLLAAKQIISEYKIFSELDIDLINLLLQEIDDIDKFKKIIIKREEADNLLAKANSLLKEKLSTMNVNGNELLDALTSKSDILLKQSFEIRTILEEENITLSNLINYENYPFTIDKEDFENCVDEQESEFELTKLKRFKLFYESFKTSYKIIKESRMFLEELDLLIGLGKTFQYHNKPEISDERFSFTNLKSRLLKDAGFDVSKINYYIDNNKTIITGANSGGKTSLLNLIVEVHLMARMGLLIDGEAKVKSYDSIYYFKKSSGSSGSGAFESTLKMFSEINKDGKALILADEIEAITEPGAASKIISAIFDWFSTDENDIIIASHLGEALQKECLGARIDGIEAESLDDNLELVVNRNPRINYLAKSTPQLIVEKLSKQAESGFFNHIMAKMKT